MESRLIPNLEGRDLGWKDVSCYFTRLFDLCDMAVGWDRDDVGDAQFSTVVWTGPGGPQAWTPNF